jgi:hypothetical protein
MYSARKIVEKTSTTFTYVYHQYNHLVNDDSMRIDKRTLHHLKYALIPNVSSQFSFKNEQSRIFSTNLIKYLQHFYRCFWQEIGQYMLLRGKDIVVDC